MTQSIPSVTIPPFPTRQLSVSRVGNVEYTYKLQLIFRITLHIRGYSENVRSSHDSLGEKIDLYT